MLSINKRQDIVENDERLHFQRERGRDRAQVGEMRRSEKEVARKSGRKGGEREGGGERWKEGRKRGSREQEGRQGA